VRVGAVARRPVHLSDGLFVGGRRGLVSALGGHSAIHVMFPEVDLPVHNRHVAGAINEYIHK